MDNLTNCMKLTGRLYATNWAALIEVVFIAFLKIIQTVLHNADDAK
jgi:hypothetical protein